MNTSDDDNQHPLPLSQRRVDPVAGKRAWVVWLQGNAADVGRGAALVSILVVIACLGAAELWRRDTLRQQARNTPMLHGTAVVIDKQADAAYRNRVVPAFLSFRMNDTIVRVDVTDAQLEKWARTLVGQTVRTSYHGIKGVYFIDDWEPPATKAPLNGGS